MAEPLEQEETDLLLGRGEIPKRELPLDCGTQSCEMLPNAKAERVAALEDAFDLIAQAARISRLSCQLPCEVHEKPEQPTVRPPAFMPDPTDGKG